MIKNRDYQSAGEKQIRQHYNAGHKAVLYVLPTGGGKTQVAASIIKQAIGKGKRILFLAHKRELVLQAHTRLAERGVLGSVIMAGHKAADNRNLYVGSVQTMIRRLDRLPREFDFIVIDEAHHTTSASFTSIINKYNNAYRLGLTATPYRLDGKPLGEHYNKLVCTVQMQELIDQGYLVPPRYYGAGKTEAMKRLHKLGGEYKSDEMFAAFDRKALYKGVVAKYKKYYHGRKQTIIFCCNIEHSISTAEEFASAGYKAAHIGSDLHHHETTARLAAFRKGEIEIITNCAVLTEGYDLPDLGCVIINRCTASKSLYTQMIGRALRPARGKDCAVIIDMGGNVYQFGFVETDQEYSLEIEKKKEKTEGLAPVKECPACGALVHASVRTCNICGHAFPVVARREIEADFEEVTEAAGNKKKAALPSYLRKPWRAMTSKELHEVAMIRGYKPGWIWYQLRAKKFYA